MKYLHVNAGNENGGGLTHIISLLGKFAAGDAGLAVLEEGPVAAAARAAGIPVFVFQQRTRADLSVLKRLTAFINEQQIQVVHTHGPRASLFLARIHKKIRARWVLTVHSDPLLDFQNNGLKGNIFTRLHLYALRQADGLIAISQAFERKLLTLGLPASKIFVAYNGIDFHQQLPNQEQHSDFVMIMIARLHPVKRHQFLFDCLCAAQLSNYQLKLIGDGPLRAELEAACREKGLEKQVEFLGFQQPQAIQKALRAADLTVLASASESFPLVLLESANEGVPFVATDVGDISKMVPEPSCSWVIAADDQVGYAAALQEAWQLWRTGQLREQGEQLYFYTKDHFSLERLYERTLEIYQQLLAI